MLKFLFADFYSQVDGEWITDNGYKYIFELDGFDGNAWYFLHKNNTFKSLSIETGQKKGVLSPGWYNKEGKRVKVKYHYIHLYDEENREDYLLILYDDKGWFSYDCRKILLYKNLSAAKIFKIITGANHNYRAIKLSKLK